MKLIKMMKAVAMCSIVLTASTATAGVECPSDEQCFTKQEARRRIKQECNENRRKWERCRLELKKRNNTEAEIQKCKGQLEECRKNIKDKAQTIRHLDKKTQQLSDRLSEKWTTGQVVLFTAGGLTFGFGIGVTVLFLLR